MKKVAVFGNTGGGKSTLSKRLSEITGLPLYALDKIQYQSGGAEVPNEEYKRTHEKILATDRWIIDGFGCRKPSGFDSTRRIVWFLSICHYTCISGG
jgi:adenylate kinase family enzyme